MKSCNESMLFGHIQEDPPSHIDKSRLLLPLISKNNHNLMEIRLPRSKLNGHLKQILRQPKQQYKKIDRGIGRSLSYLDKRKVNQNAFKLKILQTSREQPPSVVNTLTVKSQITKILNNYESSLLDHKQSHFQKRFKRPLIDKKLVTLLPQISDGKKKRKAQYISIVDRYNQIPEYNSLNTIDYPNYECINKQQKQQQEIEPLILKITKKKQKQYRSLTLQPRKIHKKLKRLKDEQYNQLQQQERYEPWKLQSEQNQDLF